MPKGNPWEDHYTRRARKEKWLARSIYKLQEIDRRLKLIRRGDRILDLGCYPGSWSQYCIQKVGPKGEVVGIDLKAPQGIAAPNFKYMQGDISKIHSQHIKRDVGNRHVVISDLAPQTTGILLADISRSMELAEKALEIAFAVLVKNGHFLCKVFEGGDLKAFREKCSHAFSRIRNIRPPAIRKGSREMYIAGLTFKGASTPLTGHADDVLHEKNAIWIKPIH